MIPTENLPLLEPLRGSPFGNAIADLVQPSLRVLVNLGYGQIEHGWDAGPANVPTTMGVLPTDINLADVFTALVNGAQQGWQDFIGDLGSLSSGAPEGSDIGADGVVATLPSFTDVVNAFSGSLAALYATLLPTADIANGLLTTLPAYMGEVFVAELAQGDIVDAIGLPISAAVGLGSIAAGFELFGFIDAFNDIQALWADIFS